jgi:flagellin-like protein
VSGKPTRLGQIRGRRRRGVSPIIGIILLVAITVVLAAVLYVLVSGYAHDGAVATPLGTALALGPATKVTGTQATNSYCGKGFPCYSISIALAETSLTITSVKLVVLTASGAPRIVQTSTAQISIVGGTGSLIAYTQVAHGKPLETSAWQKIFPGYSAHTPLTDIMTIWVKFGTKTLDPSGQGFSLDVIGTGPFSGTVNLLLP